MAKKSTIEEMRTIDQERGEKGNALFLILIAVGLFAALSYAVTQSGRGGGTIDRENIAIAQARATQFFASLQTAINRLRIINRCTPEQISFAGANGTSYETDGTEYLYPNANAPLDESCHVFKPNGGNVVPLKVPTAGLIDPSQVLCADCASAHSWVIVDGKIRGVGTDAGAAGNDVLMWFGRPTKEACIAINNALGIPNPGGNPPVDTLACGTTYVGVFNNCANPIGNITTALQGKHAFCVDWGPQWGMPSNYAYIQVLLAR